MIRTVLTLDAWLSGNGWIPSKIIKLLKKLFKKLSFDCINCWIWPYVSQCPA